MADAQGNRSSFGPDFYLNPKEQDLLLNALNSNMPPVTGTPTSKRPSSLYLAGQRQNSNPQRSNSGESPLFSPPAQQTPVSAGLTNSGFDDSPYLDGELDESNFDWDLNGDLIGGLPGASGTPDGEEEHGDKRKSPEDGEDEDGGGKRHENGDKTSKKPGRKPLTSEPTSKRKAQNRAAQRAFRERKEKHLKDLETKVEDLEKASEATNHENGVLKAQVDRLQTELKEYRRRLSMNAKPNTFNRSSPTSYSIGQPFTSKRNWDINNNFQFDFPRFGPDNSQIKQRSSPGSAQNLGPMFTSGGMTSTPFPMNPELTQPAPSPAFSGANGEDYSTLFSPTTISSADSRSGVGDNVSTKPAQSRSASYVNGVNGYTRHNSSAISVRRNGSEVTAASPASQFSNQGLASSSATTPESAADSPGQYKGNDVPVRAASEEKSGQTGNSGDLSSTDSSLGNQPDTPALDLQSFDWLASQNGGVFDPVLFGDYRDPQESVMNNDMSNNFFSEAFPLSDFSATPAEKPLQPTLPKKKDLMQEIEERQAGQEPDLKAQKEPQHFLTCNLLWDRVQRSDKVQNGEADMDDLCSQLKSKAKCSGSGPVISQSDVDQILGLAPTGEVQPDVWKMFK